MTMNSEVTDYTATTGNRTGEYGGHVDQKSGRMVSV